MNSDHWVVVLWEIMDMSTDTSCIDEMRTFVFILKQMKMRFYFLWLQVELKNKCTYLNVILAIMIFMLFVVCVSFLRVAL